MSDQKNYASLSIRGAAYAIDLAVVIFGGSFFWFLFGVGCLVIFPSVEFPISVTTFWWITVTVFNYLYYALMESSNKQATLGKMLYDLKVTNLQGNKPSFKRALARNLLKPFSGLLFNFGFIMIVLHRKNQGLHDLIAKCLVLRNPD